MNKELQKIKIERKIELIMELIKSLVSYNNIDGYDNQKKFTIKFDCQKKMFESLYFYKINIIRGIDNPKNIFNLRFIYDENTTKILEYITESFINNEFFSHTTFSRGLDTNKYVSYNINLKNNVELKLGIKTENDLAMFNEIEKRFDKKEVRLDYLDISDKTKDEIQEQKFINITQIFNKIMNILVEYNSIEYYDNKKPFKLIISNIYDKNKHCYIYTYSIIRGNIKRENLFTLRASIENKNIALNNIYDLLLNFKNNDKFLIETTNIDDKKYTIYLTDDILIEFKCNDEKDFKFCSNFKKETTNNSQYIMKDKNLIHSYKNKNNKK